MSPRALRPLVRFAPRALLATTLALATPSGPAVAQPEPEATWERVAAAAGAGRLEEAARAVGRLLEAAQARGDDEEIARALVERTRLRLALGGYETAVEELAAAEWPRQPLAEATVRLYYARALSQYQLAYAWEIGRRERVAGDLTLDLDLWTSAQLAAETRRQLARVFAMREALGALPAAASLALEPNDYPPGVRDTLRDAVSYLFAEELADSSHWRPAEHELWRLDRSALVAGEGAVSEAALVAPETHPLAAMAAVLGDLERWHRVRGERAAELEARIQRLERLRQHLTGAEERAALAADLEARLAAFDDSPWWSRGMATRADWRRGEADADALVTARELALAGERAFPESWGAAACRRIRAEIEAPALEIAAMAVDTPGERSIEVTHANLERVHFRAYRIDVEQRLREVWRGGLDPRGDQELEALLATPAAAAWFTDLPPTPDYRSHRTFVVPPVQDKGRYVLIASAHADFRTASNRRVALPIELSDLVLVVEDGEALDVLALDGHRGNPRAAVELTVYGIDWRQPPRVVGSARTDASGRARFRLPVNRRGGYFLRAHDGLDQASFSLRGPWRGARHETETRGSLVFTDRAIYRPGQSVRFKVMAFSTPPGSSDHRPLVAQPVSVALVDPNGERVATVETTTNDFGTAAGALAIPLGRPLGDWTVAVTPDGSASIAVEEYKRPTFEVAIDPPGEELRLGSPARLHGSARYYFGQPVAGGSVAWRVERQPILPLRWHPWGGRIWPPVPTESRVVASGKGRLASDGTFAVEFTPEADPASRGTGTSFRFQLTADVTDPGGETRGASHSVRLGWVAVEARLEDEATILDGATPMALAIVRSDLGGAPRAGEGRYRLTRLATAGRALLPAEVPADPAVLGAGREPLTAGDRLRPRWSEAPGLDDYLALAEERAEVRAGTLRHGDDGRARLALGRLDPGAYRLHYETRDRFGERFELVSDFVVAGARTPLPAPLALAFAEASVAPGGVARLFVGSGLAGQTVFLERVRGEEVVARWTQVVGRGSDWLEIPIAEADRGGFAVRARLVADHQDVRAAATLEVPWVDRRLDLAFSTFRDRLRPGASERFAITVSDPDGEPLGAGAAEVLASMYDRSLDALRQAVRPRLADLYPSRAGFPGFPATTLGQAQALWWSWQEWRSLPTVPSLQEDRFRAIDPYGIGGPGGRGRMTFGRMEMVARAPRPGDIAAAPAVEAREEITLTADAPAVVSATTSGVAAKGPLPATMAPAPVELRSEFAETAFFHPQLLTHADGSVSIDFEVPDSVTSWTVWAVAATRALAMGEVERTAESVKELLVRPYLPRFLREGDRATLRVLVQNAGDAPFAGEARLALADPATDDDLAAAFGLAPEQLAAPFEVEPGGSATLEFPLVAPSHLGPVSVRIEARAGAYSDGELRPLPILPARVRLAQSRFVALSGADRRELDFADLRRDDPTRENEQMVVTVDGQLFYSALAALPYLVDYPYECTEQTLNRFLSTGILSSLFGRFPAVAAMAAALAERETRYERFDAPDPNRTLALEETPWLAFSRGGDDDPQKLLRVLDPQVAEAQRRASLAKLAEAQLPSGAFPWFPGGPPSAWSTLYLLYGLSKASEFGIEVPEEMVRSGWSYLAGEARRDWLPRAERDGCCYESLAFLAYVASSYPDRSWLEPLLGEGELDRILELAFAHRRDLAPMTKLMLSMTLRRAGRDGDARLVLASVVDSAKTTQDEGTFWAPEERAWLWYNDTVETHAWAIRALLEIAPEDPRLPGLVQWVFLEKKLGHWKSTRATAEVLYSLAKYLAATGALAVREEIRVAVPPVEASFVFEPDRFTGKRNQLVVDGAKLGPASATVVAEKSTPGLAFVSATWHFSTEELPETSRGDLLSVERTYYRRDTSSAEAVLVPLADDAQISVGDELEVRLDLTARAPAEYVHLRDPRPAGFEPAAQDSGWTFEGGVASYREIRDSGADFFLERLPQGKVTLRHRLRAATAGVFRAGPAQLESIYAPEFTAYSAGERVAVSPADP